MTRLTVFAVLASIVLLHPSSLAAQSGSALEFPRSEPDTETLPPPPSGSPIIPYAQLGAGLLLRESGGAVDPTFTQRTSVKIRVLGGLRLGVALLIPMFSERYQFEGSGTGYSSSSYLGGLEVAYRAQYDALALHVGGNVAVGGGPNTSQIPSTSFDWPTESNACSAQSV